MKITHVKSRFVIGNNQDRLEQELIKLKSENYEVIQVVNNGGAFSFMSLLMMIFSPVKIYTIISKSK